MAKYIDVFIHTNSRETWQEFMKAHNISFFRDTPGTIVVVDITDGRVTGASAWRPFVSRTQQFVNDLQSNSSFMEPALPEDRAPTDAVSVEEFIQNYYEGIYE